MSRSKSVIKNTAWEMGYYIAVIALGFLAPRYIILYYSSEVNGLTSTIQHIINIVLMLQAGAATAAVFSLYKPIADNNYNEICDNIKSAENFFRRISYIFGGLMLLIAIVTPFVLNTKLDRLCVFVAMVIMGMKSFVDLFYTAKFRIIFTAYQQKFYISIATLLELAVYYVLVFVTIFMYWHYILIYVWFFLGCIIKIIILKKILRKVHPELLNINDNNNDCMILGRNYALANELSHSFMGSSVVIIISFMYGLAETSVYSIYALVSAALGLLTTSLYSSFAPSFGNLYAQGDNERSAYIFSKFKYIFVMFSTFLMMCMLFTVVPFVKIYISEANDIDYINYNLAMIMAICGVFSAYRIPYNIVVSSCGFFKETWLQPVVTMFLCIGLSFVFGCIDYTLIMAGLVVFFAVNFIYQHFRLKQIIPYLIHSDVFVMFSISMIGLLLTFLVNSCIEFPTGVLSLIGWGLIFACATVGYIVISSMLFLRKEFIETVKYLKSLMCIKSLWRCDG